MMVQNFFNTQIFPPSSNLAKFVKHYRWVSFPILKRSFWVPSDSRNLILFVLKGQGLIEDLHYTYKQPRFCIRGPWDTSFKISFEGNFIQVLGVELTEIGLHHITGKSVKNFVNAFEMAEKYLPAKTATFIQEMNHLEQSPEEQVRQMEKLLIKCLDQNPPHINTGFQDAVRVARMHQGNCTVKEMARECFLHEKTMNRLFVKYTGMSSKRYLNLIKFEDSCRELLNNPKQRFSELELGKKYFDQSHFIHSFKTHGGIQPGNLDKVDISWIRFLLNE